eukprot:GHVH01000972.1.p1 GENE.GHVH01000972.1~~GHVH01000972.1.p1  ORF type:complete len:107 (+),score=12.13 GHVH01000972.1:161-481(+)
MNAAPSVNLESPAPVSSAGLEHLIITSPELIQSQGLHHLLATPGSSHQQGFLNSDLIDTPTLSAVLGKKDITQVGGHDVNQAVLLEGRVIWIGDGRAVGDRYERQL